MYKTLDNETCEDFKHDEKNIPSPLRSLTPFSIALYAGVNKGILWGLSKWAVVTCQVLDNEYMVIFLYCW